MYLFHFNLEGSDEKGVRGFKPFQGSTFTDVLFSPHGVGMGGGTLEQRLEHNYALPQSMS